MLHDKIIILKESCIVVEQERQFYEDSLFDFIILYACRFNLKTTTMDIYL